MELRSFETLALELRDAALLVTINRPQALNALAGQVVHDLSALLDDLEGALAQGWPVRALVITGAGERSFVAGADIAEMSQMSPAEGEAYSRAMQAVTRRLELLPVPVIAAVNGFALGGGCELALACDWIYASSTAKFGQPEVNLGLVPGFGASVRLARRVGPALARELIFTGRTIDADQALRIGLVNQVLPSGEGVVEAAVATTRELSRKSPVAVAACKRLMEDVEDQPVDEGLAREATAFRRAFETDDKREGVRAFLAKEEAHFPGR